MLHQTPAHDGHIINLPLNNLPNAVFSIPPGIFHQADDRQHSKSEIIAAANIVVDEFRANLPMAGDEFADTVLYFLADMFDVLESVQ